MAAHRWPLRSLRDSKPNGSRLNMPTIYAFGCNRERRQAARLVNAIRYGARPRSALDWKPVSDPININARQAYVGEFTVGHDRKLTGCPPALMPNAKRRDRLIDFPHDKG